MTGDFPCCACCGIGRLDCAMPGEDRHPVPCDPDMSHYRRCCGDPCEEKP